MLRFAPSPIGDMSIEDLRVALFNSVIAQQKEDQFILRIEDREKEKNIEGKDTEILQILEKFALPHDRVFHQSENLHIQQTLAIRLLEEERAFACSCSTQEREDIDPYSGKCSSMTDEELQRLKEEKIPFVLRIRKPKETIKYHDLIKGDIESPPDAVDSFIILDADGVPTYNFACACDDMLTGVDFIIRGEEHLYDTPKQIYIKQLLGYDAKTTYAHLPAIENIGDQEISQSVKSLFAQGYIPDAIINYLLQLGYETPKDIFTLPEALEWFSLEDIAKTPAKFDREKLRSINREHIKMMDNRTLSMLFGFADIAIGQLAKSYLAEASTLNELDDKIKAIFAPKVFDGTWGEQMQRLRDIIFQAKPIDDFDAFERFLKQESQLIGEEFSQSLRILLTGTDHGPELRDIYPHIKSYLLEIAS